MKATTRECEGCKYVTFIMLDDEAPKKCKHCGGNMTIKEKSIEDVLTK